MPLNLTSLRATRNAAFRGSGAQQPVIGQQLIYWPGKPATATYIFAPKLRSNATLKNFGGVPDQDNRAIYKRPNVHPTVVRQLYRNVNAQMQFNAAGDSLAVPGVFVPTSLANGYGGFVR